jgi:hypothetical protein
MRREALAVLLLAATGLSCVPAGTGSSPGMHWEVDTAGGGYRERFWADGVFLVETRGPFDVVLADGTRETLALQDLDEGGEALHATFTASFGTLRREVRRLGGYPWLRIENRLEVGAPVRLARLTDVLRFVPPDPEFAWSQNLKWEATDVLPHWTFKFPALLVQKGPLALSLLADIDLISKPLLERAPLAFDMAVDEDGRYRLAYGFIAHALGKAHHVHYRAAPEAPVVLAPGTYSWAYFPVLEARAPEREAFRRLLRHTWERWGRPRFLAGARAQQGTGEQAPCRRFDDWRQEAWERFGPSVWHQWDRGGEIRGGYSTFWIKDPNVWFDAWFASVRTAYGEMRYARRFKVPEAEARAHAVLNLVLSAPRKEGLFPSIYVCRDGKDSWEFENTRREGRYAHDYHLFDMTWTATWLLRVKRDLLPEDPRILPFCEDLAGFLLKRQRGDGGLPAWFREDLAPDPDMGEINAEVSGSLLFLAELHRMTGKAEYLKGARKAADYLWREIVPTRRWYDFEAFVSCSKKPFDFYDPWTRQYPANTLSMIRAAQGMLALYEAAGSPADLERARAVADHLLLYQQPWSHPLMAEDLIGGFAVQNSDLEWSDTRAPYAADLLFGLYAHTGELEYLERAVAALRANFKVSPRENWGHRGDAEGPTGKPKFHWGTGSGAATVEMFADAYGEAFLHVGRRHGVGVDGCTLRRLRMDADVVEAEIDSPFDWPRRARLVLSGLASGQRLVLCVNGERFEVVGDAQGRAELAFTMRKEAGS